MTYLDKITGDKLRTIFSLRRIKMVALALVVIWATLILFFTIALPATVIQTLAGVLVEHGNYIRSTNAVVALMCAAFFLLPKAGGQLVGRWNFYVGLAFFTFFVQYGMRTISFSMELYVLLPDHPDINSVLKQATMVVVYVGSSLNNLLLLAAARILLHKNRHQAQTITSNDDDESRVQSFAQRAGDAFVALYAALPRWVWPVVVVVTLIAALYEDSPGKIFLFARFPDAFFSLYCLSWFGYAVALNFWVRGQRALACLAFCATLAYGAGQLVYAANSPISYTIISDTESSIPRVRQTVQELSKNVTKFVGRDFVADDLMDEDKLLIELSDVHSPFSESFTAATHVLEPAESALKAAERSLPGSSAAPQRKLNIIVRRLNYLLNQQSIYKPDGSRVIELRKETQALNRPLRDGDLIRLRNRLLLEDTYPKYIKQAGTPKDALDNAIFAVLFPMKYLLFLPAFALYLLSIISVNNFRPALSTTTRKRTDYLSNKGILDVIGNSLNANEVELLIRLPGVQRGQGVKEERVLAETWRSPETLGGRKVPRVYPIKEDQWLVEVMQKKGGVKVITHRDNCEEAGEMSSVGNRCPKTEVIIPISFHGGIIGALRVTFTGYGKYNDGTLEQLKFLSELIAPSAQDLRTVSAIDKLGGRLIRMLVEDLSQNRMQPDAKVEGQEGAIKTLVSGLYDLLTPLGVCLIVDCGFTSVKRIFPEEGIYYEILNRQQVRFDGKGRSVMHTEQGPVGIEVNQLSGSNERGYRYPLGALLLAIREDKDHFTQPTLAAHYLTRRMLASLVSNGILSAARIFLSGIIQNLGVALNKETLSFDEWFREIKLKVKESGLLWVVASSGEGWPLRGEQEHIALLSRLTAEERETLLSKPLSCIVSREPDHKTRHIIHLKLDHTPEARLWFGVVREGFGAGPELNFKSPWSDFLNELAKVAGAAFASIEDRQSHEAQRRREEKERLKAAEDEWLRTIAVISAMLMHQLVNMVRNQLDTAEDLLEMLSSGSLEATGQAYRSIVAIKESAEMMQALTNACSNLTKSNEPWVCDLGEAAQQTQSLFQFGLRKKKIEIQTDIPSGATAKLPLNVGTLALASLIGNAIDAVKAKGKIEIKAELADGFVLCHVVNDGQAIPSEIKRNMFRLGMTSKQGHTGWGLYLVSRVLEKYGGEIYLSNSDTQATCFTLRLPASED